MVISTSLSTASVAYFLSDGTPAGSAEADGAEFAVITATILDGGSSPVAGAQVVFELDPATPDRTGSLIHAQERPDGQNFASITDAFGVASATLFSQDSANSPLTIDVRAGEDNGGIANFSAPTSSSTGASPPHGTTLGATIYSDDGEIITDTEFTGLVEVRATNVQFFNCTFDGGGLIPTCVLIEQGLKRTLFTDCTFTGSTGHAIIGNGFRAVQCYWTDIGLSAVDISTLVVQEAFTKIENSLIERCGGAAPAPGITASPGHRLIVRGSKIDCPHESSTNAVVGYEGRGPINIITRRPSTASNFRFELCWLYGGDDYCVDARSLDDGNTPSALRLSACRWGDPADNQNPAGALGYVRSTDDVGFIAQGNVQDADGALIDVLNTHAGVGWYWPSVFLDVPPVATFDPEPFPEATVDPPNPTPAPEPPVTDPVENFSTTAYQNTPAATVPVNTVEPVGQALDLEGNPLYEDPYRDAVPTARGLYPPQAREGSTQPPAFEVQFAMDDLFRSVIEDDTVVNLTIESTQVVTDPVTVNLVYSGSASQDTGDYAAPASVIIAAGTDSVELPITIFSDTDLGESDEQVLIVIDSVSSGLRGALSMASVEIQPFPQDVGAEPPTASFLTTGLTIVEGDTASFKVGLTRAGAVDCDIDYSIPTNQLSVGEFTDVTGGQITITAGLLSADIVISTVDDEVVESQEAMVIQLDAITPGFDLGTQVTAILRVNDNDFVQVADVQFTQAASQTLESSTNEIRIMASIPLDGDIDVSFTETAGPGLTGADYDLVDIFGDPITSPITMPSGTQVAQIYFQPVDDTQVEGDETLTLTITGVTGNSVLGGQLEHVATIIDNDTSGPGADGDLYGLVPERTVVDLTGAEYDVYPDRFERAANVGLGITALTVSTGGFYLSKAISDAQVYWEALNTGNVATLQDRTQSLYAEGVTVRIRVNGDCDQSGFGEVEWSTNVGGARAAAWSSSDLPIVRDLVIFGASDWVTDIIGHQVYYDDFREDIEGGTYDGQRRITANIRYERLSIEGNRGFQRNIGVVALSPALTEAQVNGFFRYYNVRFTNDRDSSLTRPQKWNVRSLSLTAGWDFRGCYSYLALEHFVYVNSPRGGFYVVGCTSERGGYSSTFCQSVNRRYDAGRTPGVSPYGTGDIVYMRNVIWDTSSGEEVRGGADLTIQGQNAACYFVENEHLGSALHGSGGSRGAIVVYSGADYDGLPLVSDWFDIDGFEYSTRSVHIRGDIIAWEDGNGRSSIGLSGVKEIHVNAFTMGGVHFREQFTVDKVGDSSLDSLRMINGEPSRGATHGFFWDLRWPNWNSAPWTGDITDYPGWASTTKMINSRSRRLGNYSSERRVLSSNDINRPFDGEATWTEGNVTPEAAWQQSRIGLPVGADLSILACDISKSRSIFEQVWTYERQFDNYDAGRYDEVRNSLIAVSGGGASGTMTFTYYDNSSNYDFDERPQIDIENTTTPPNPSEPGMIRYQLIDVGPNAEITGDDDIQVFVYSPGSFGVFQWDQVRYGSAGVHTVDLSTPGSQDVYIETSSATWMEERINVTVNPASTTASLGINNFNWEFAPGATLRSVRLVNLSAASPGETLVLDINTATVNGITAGSIGSTSQLTITFA